LATELPLGANACRKSAPEAIEQAGITGNEANAKLLLPMRIRMSLYIGS
jgi:hypothetical protein